MAGKLYKLVSKRRDGIYFYFPYDPEVCGSLIFMQIVSLISLEDRFKYSTLNFTAWDVKVRG